MKLIRSDSPEVARCIASAGALASWGSIVLPVCVGNSLGLLIVLTIGRMVSVRAAAWVGIPVFLALNGFLLWRGTSPRLNWILAVCADRVYIRLFVRRGRGRSDVHEPNVLVLEATEIALMSIRSVELFLDGPNPRKVERLLIEPTKAVADEISRHIRTLLAPEGKQVFVASGEGHLAIEWRWCRPILPVFLERTVLTCPSIVVVHEELSELDLNGVWRGISRNLRHNLDPQERQKLVQAKRLGFGCECAGLLGRYKHISFQQAAAYLTEFEQEGTKNGEDSPTQNGVTAQDLHL